MNIYNVITMENNVYTINADSPEVAERDIERQTGEMVVEVRDEHEG